MLNKITNRIKAQKGAGKIESGFTLIELLVVIAIIGILAGILFVAINPKEQTDKANDAKRLSDMKTIQQALEMYLLEHGRYPDPDNSGTKCSGWDTGNQTSSMLSGKLSEYLSKVPVDPEEIDCSHGGGYRYYRYSAGANGCDASKGSYYVLGTTDMKTSTRPYKDSPGFTCDNRDWETEFDWVTGAFEN